ncbi:MAG TPA: hypothetical protein DD687_04075 [Verrucomicrobiales bacterium]|nr:hypothetical protein [Verrucomicrobiales bacterium]
MFLKSVLKDFDIFKCVGTCFGFSCEYSTTNRSTIDRFVEFDFMRCISTRLNGCIRFQNWFLTSQNVAKADLYLESSWQI